MSKNITIVTLGGTPPGWAIRAFADRLATCNFIQFGLFVYLLEDAVNKENSLNVSFSYKDECDINEQILHRYVPERRIEYQIFDTPENRKKTHLNMSFPGYRMVPRDGFLDECIARDIWEDSLSVHVPPLYKGSSSREKLAFIHDFHHHKSQ